MSQNYNFKQARELNPSAGQPRAGDSVSFVPAIPLQP
ncbi:unnamed protein product [Mycena citricolor]|uniref:Uncharacterized protein n=1 Tax=Mycena citricolor TaxID=2018698 RepID=A0AAD2JYD1_9AGAR|nr:unnamed protein product [Mycena citricolor]